METGILPARPNKPHTLNYGKEFLFTIYKIQRHSAVGADCHATDGPPKIDLPDCLGNISFHRWSPGPRMASTDGFRAIYGAIGGPLCHRWSPHATLSHLGDPWRVSLYLRHVKGKINFLLGHSKLISCFPSWSSKIWHEAVNFIIPLC